jgi:hypothetical protein
MQIARRMIACSKKHPETYNILVDQITTKQKAAKILTAKLQPASKSVHDMLLVFGVYATDAEQ